MRADKTLSPGAHRLGQKSSPCVKKPAWGLAPPGDGPADLATVASVAGDGVFQIILSGSQRSELR